MQFVFSNVDLASNDSDEAIVVERTGSRRGRIGIPRQTETRSRTKSSRQNSEDVSSDESENEQHFEYFSRVTRSGNAVLNLMKRIERIMNNEESADIDSIKCIICCDNKKSIVLFPCRHQHTCEPCWSLWRMQCLDRVTSRTFDENDDNAMKPTCPYCKSHVDSGVKAIN